MRHIRYSTNAVPSFSQRIKSTRPLVQALQIWYMLDSSRESEEPSMAAFSESR